MNLFNNKHILITHTLIGEYMGSSIVVYDMARYLISSGAKVDVYCSVEVNPLKEYFDKSNINIITNEQKLKDVSYYDYIFVNSQVFPMKTLYELIQVNTEDRPFIIFNHMSALKEAADEFPYIFGFEEKLSSLSLFVSQEALNESLNYYLNVDSINAKLMQNFVTTDFCNVQTKHTKDTPSNIAIVSNHIPEELQKAANKLMESGYTVDIFGTGHIQQMITAEVLSKYDCVVSIGKTVYYSLCMGVPVYIYDHFGGCGYLNDSNFEEQRSVNFSGRNSMFKSAKQIKYEIINNFNVAKQYIEQNRKFIISQFSFDDNFEKLFEGIEKPDTIYFTESELNHISSQQIFARRYYLSWDWQNWAKREMAKRDEKINLQQNKIEELTNNVALLQNENNAIKNDKEDLQNQLNEIYSSRIYKILVKIRNIFSM